MVLSGGAGLTLLWVASFKLIAYSGNRGALAHPSLRGKGNELRWAALLALPFFPAKRGRQPATTSPVVALAGVLLKLAVWLGLSVLLLTPENVGGTLRHVCYAIHFWMFVSLCLDAFTPLSGHLLGASFPLQPAMDAPYASTSVREFWGARYNQIVSATLQETVYKPIVSGAWVAPHAPPSAAHVQPAGDEGAAAPGRGALSEPTGAGPAAAAAHGNLAVRAGPGRAAPAPQQQPAATAAALDAAGVRRRTPMWLAFAALAASFAVSGIMHEICVLIMCGRLEGSFRLMAFFMLQPVFILLQELAHAALVPKAIREGGGGVVGRVVRVFQAAITLTLVLASAELFWLPLEACDIDVRGLQEVVSVMQLVAEHVKQRL